MADAWGPHNLSICRSKLWENIASICALNPLITKLCMGRGEHNSKTKWIKGMILRALERCRSMGSHHKAAERRHNMPPEGCVSVYVGPARERFVVRTECINHPLFQVLLDEAEMEFGHSNTGPLELPCDVELFHKVLWEMEQEAVLSSSPWCNFARGSGSGYRLLIKPGTAISGRPC